jgi:hypothetical protein
VTIVELINAPLPQDPTYHLFADRRTLLHIANFWNVTSNLPFLIVGLLGIAETTRHRADPLRIVWFVFFAGIFLTGFGSGYYHLTPDNASLAWDRLLMTVGFMSFVAIIIGEYLSLAWARRMLLPLLVIGTGSVFYWSHTETLGAGDLRPYAVVQFLPMILTPAIILTARKRSDLGRYIGWMIACYAIAKLFEYYDHQVFAAGELLSGHSIKHVLAALGASSLLLGMYRRRVG